MNELIGKKLTALAINTNHFGMIFSTDDGAIYKIDTGDEVPDIVGGCIDVRLSDYLGSSITAFVCEYGRVYDEYLDNSDEWVDVVGTEIKIMAATAATPLSLTIEGHAKIVRVS